MYRQLQYALYMCTGQLQFQRVLADVGTLETIEANQCLQL